MDQTTSAVFYYEYRGYYNKIFEKPIHRIFITFINAINEDSNSPLRLPLELKNIIFLNLLFLNQHQAKSKILCEAKNLFNKFIGSNELFFYYSYGDFGWKHEYIHAAYYDDKKNCIKKLNSFMHSDSQYFRNITFFIQKKDDDMTISRIPARLGMLPLVNKLAIAYVEDVINSIALTHVARKAIEEAIPSFIEAGMNLPIPIIFQTTLTL